MSLLHGIAEILEGKEYAEVQADLGNMVVEEFTQQRSDNAPLKTVLLCESPHEQEICHGYALAGETGERITAALRRVSDVCDNMPAIDSQDPIGSLLREPTQHPVLNSLGLMNVSSLPLQKGPYCQHIQQDADYMNLLRAFGKIKTRAQRSSHQLDFRRSTNSDEALITMMQQIRNIVLMDLARRLYELPNGALVIPCGHFARNFLRRAESACRRQWSSQLPTELQSVSHPSRWPRSSLPCWQRILLSLICTRAVQ